MDQATKTRIEYEHQLFGFSSDSLIDSYKEMLNEAICDKALNSVAKMLKDKLGPSAKDPEALDKGVMNMVDDLRTSYESGIDYAIKQYEGRIRDCFRIPDYLLLEEDRIVSTVEGVNEEDVDKEIDELKQELKNIAIVLEEAKQEEICADEAISVLEEALQADFKPLPKNQ